MWSASGLACRGGVGVGSAAGAEAEAEAEAAVATAARAWACPRGPRGLRLRLRLPPRCALALALALALAGWCVLTGAAGVEAGGSPQPLQAHQLTQPAQQQQQQQQQPAPLATPAALVATAPVTLHSQAVFKNQDFFFISPTV
ncbi:Protein of unknown function [Gryllus bimaculatus]|nr:Protein of unknown function [Gryllus bimaculatus]